MAYSAVPTKNVGDTWSAADNNTYIKDNFAAGVPDIFTTKGDLAVATAADAATRLGVGTNGQFLTVDSSTTTGLKWATSGIGGAQARYALASAKSIANATSIAIVNYATQTYDTVSAVTTGTAWKFTVPATGYYFVAANLVLTSNAGWAVGEYADLRVVKNNGSSTVVMGASFVQATGTYQVAVNGATALSLTAGNTIDVRCYQNSGGAINTVGTAGYNHVSISRIF